MGTSIRKQGNPQPLVSCFLFPVPCSLFPVSYSPFPYISFLNRKSVNLNAVLSQLPGKFDTVDYSNSLLRLKHYEC
jgi:hypothetical protein